MKKEKYKFSIYLVEEKATKFKEYTQSRDCNYSDCIREGIELREQERLNKRKSDKKVIEMRTDQKEYLEIKDKADKEGLSITKYLEGCIDLVLEKK